MSIISDLNMNIMQHYVEIIIRKMHQKTIQRNKVSSPGKFKKKLHTEL